MARVMDILSHSLLTGLERRGHSLLVAGCTFTAAGLGVRASATGTLLFILKIALKCFEENILAHV